MTAHIVRNEVITPATLSASDFDALVDGLYRVQSEIFDGVSRDELERYVVGSKADDTQIQVSYGEDGDLAGYIAMHAFRRTFRGEPCIVTRAEAGLRRAYRGDGSPASFFVSRLLKTRWSFSGAHYYLGCLVHPSSYSAFARDAATLWPAPGVEIPADVLDLMIALGDEFGLAVVDPRHPLVRHVGWITRDTDVERRYWQTTNRPAPRFYIDQNPGYGVGHGLLTLVPLDAASLGKTVMKWGATRLKKSIQRTVSAVERTVLRPRISEQAAEGLLTHIEDLVGFDLDAIREMGVLGARFPVPARTVLFRAGDQSDVMYLILEGSVFVLDEGKDGEETVIDQLGPGSTVGEMGVATGQPRTATVRTAVDSVLLRLTAKEFTQSLTTEPRLADALWDRICWRTFGLHLRNVAASSGLSHQAQYAWYLTGGARGLAERRHLKLSGKRVLILAFGELTVESAKGWMSLTAPAVVTLPKGATIKALTACRIAILPAEPPGPAA